MLTWAAKGWSGVDSYYFNLFKHPFPLLMVTELFDLGTLLSSAPDSEGKHMIQGQCTADVQGTVFA
jgi:hypothetical protein